MITILTDRATHHMGQDLHEKIAGLHPSARLFCADDLNVEPCYACRGCDEKTFRRCVIRDGGDIVLPCLVSAEVIIMFTSIVYGGFSFPIKRIADRFLLLMPKGYSYRNGEMTSGRGPGIDYYVIGTHEDACEDEIRAFKLLVEENHRITGWRGTSIVLPEDENEYNNLVRKVANI